MSGRRESRFLIISWTQESNIRCSGSVSAIYSDIVRVRILYWEERALTIPPGVLHLYEYEQSSIRLWTRAFRFGTRSTLMINDECDLTRSKMSESESESESESDTTSSGSPSSRQKLSLSPSSSKRFKLFSDSVLRA